MTSPEIEVMPHVITASVKTRQRAQSGGTQAAVESRQQCALWQLNLFCLKLQKCEPMLSDSQISQYCLISVTGIIIGTFGSSGSYLLRGTGCLQLTKSQCACSKVRGFKPGWGRWISLGRKNLNTSPPGGTLSRGTRVWDFRLVKELQVWAKFNRRIHVLVIP